MADVKRLRNGEEREPASPLLARRRPTSRVSPTVGRASSTGSRVAELAPATIGAQRESLGHAGTLLTATCPAGHGFGTSKWSRQRSTRRVPADRDLDQLLDETYVRLADLAGNPATNRVLINYQR